jgi:hypothetical protein
MRRRRTTIAAMTAALTAAALLVAGCGGGGSDSSSTTAKAPKEPAALSKAELISQGDAICAEVNAALGSLGGTEGEANELTIQTANLYTGMVERLTELGAPKEEEGYAEFSEAAQTLAKVEGQLKLAAEREELEAQETAANEAVPALEGFESTAAVYGFSKCSEEPSAPTASPGTTAPGSEEVAPEEGGVEPEVAPEIEEEVVPEEEYVPEEEVAPEEGGGVGGAPEEVVPEEGGSESGGVGPG